MTQEELDEKVRKENLGRIYLDQLKKYGIPKYYSSKFEGGRTSFLIVVAELLLIGVGLYLYKTSPELYDLLNYFIIPLGVLLAIPIGVLLYDSGEDDNFEYMKIVANEKEYELIEKLDSNYVYFYKNRKYKTYNIFKFFSYTVKYLVKFGLLLWILSLFAGLPPTTIIIILLIIIVVQLNNR